VAALGAVVFQPDEIAMAGDKARPEHAKIAAMLEAYLKTWQLEDQEQYKTVGAEIEFLAPIRNPATNAKSRTFVLAGKLDAIFQDRATGMDLLVEHKTTTKLDESYVEKVWMDLQIQLYTNALATEDIDGLFGGSHLAGYVPKPGEVLYDVVVKPQLRYSYPETEGDYQTRLAALIEKSKTGKSSAKRKEGETLVEFQTRMVEWMLEKPGRLERIRLTIPQDRIDAIRRQVWDLTKAWLDARLHDNWYQNTHQCLNRYGRRCEFLPICQSLSNPTVISLNYQPRAKIHGELAEIDSTPTRSQTPKGVEWLDVPADPDDGAGTF